MLEIEGEARIDGLEIIRPGVDRRDCASVAAAVPLAAVELAAGRVGKQHRRAAALGCRKPLDEGAVPPGHWKSHANTLSSEMPEHGHFVGDLVRGPPACAIDTQHVPSARGLDEKAVVEPAMQKAAG